MNKKHTYNSHSKFTIILFNIFVLKGNNSNNFLVVLSLFFLWNAVYSKESGLAYPLIYFTSFILSHKGVNLIYLLFNSNSCKKHKCGCTIYVSVTKMYLLMDNSFSTIHFPIIIHLWGGGEGVLHIGMICANMKTIAVGWSQYFPEPR